MLATILLDLLLSIQMPFQSLGFNPTTGQGSYIYTKNYISMLQYFIADRCQSQPLVLVFYCSFFSLAFSFHAHLCSSWLSNQDFILAWDFVGLLRCGKSCRLRWINYLRADLKRGNFTREEEETIINLHRSVGNKWSLIASKLPGRTDNEVKNYWNSHLSRKIYSFRSSDGSSVTTLDMVNMPSKSKRKGGRVSRAVAKKYSMHPITKAPITTATNETSSSPKISSTSGVQEATTAAQNAQVGMVEATTHGVPESAAAAEKVSDDAAVGAVEESGKHQLQPMANNNYDYDESEGGCTNSMHDIRCDGGEGCARALLVPSPEKLEGEKGVAGPNDELDDVTLLLESVLESELMDLSEISVHTGDTENESIMYPESASINKDSDSGASYSNSDTGDGLYDCFAPLDSYFNHTWDAEYAVPGFGLWDQEDDDVLWPWES